MNNKEFVIFFIILVTIAYLAGVGFVLLINVLAPDLGLVTQPITHAVTVHSSTTNTGISATTIHSSYGNKLT